MSAELLREAAAQIRADISDPLSWTTEDDFHAAVADWLELIANWRGPEGERRWTHSDSCDFAALGVATAYLGGPR